MKSRVLCLEWRETSWGSARSNLSIEFEKDEPNAGDKWFSPGYLISL